jgi:hypothetical protein
MSPIPFDGRPHNTCFDWWLVPTFYFGIVGPSVKGDGKTKLGGLRCRIWGKWETQGYLENADHSSSGLVPQRLALPTVIPIDEIQGAEQGIVRSHCGPQPYVGDR